MVLRFLVRYQTLTTINTKMDPLKGSSKYLQLKFTFASTEWASLRKTLYVSSGDYALPFELTSDTFDVPTYFTQQDSFSITLLGDDADGRVVPTNVLTVFLNESNTLWTAQPPDPENSAYLQLLRSVGSLEDLHTETKTSLVAAVNEVLDRLGSQPSSGPTESVVLADGATDKNYKIFVSDGKLTMELLESVAGSAELTLADQTTRKKYKIYISSGKLTMEEV